MAVHSFDDLKAHAGHKAEYYKKLQTKEEAHRESMELGEIAEMWWFEQGNEIPERHTSEWKKMYEAWIDSWE